MYRVMYLIALTLVSYGFGETVAGANLNISRLEDGLLVELGEDLQIEEGRWTILVTMTTINEAYMHERRQLIVEETEYIETKIGLLPASIVSINNQKDSWRRQLDLLKTDQTVTFDYNKREKRGLFDGVGKASQWLFGTATQQEVDDIRKEMQDVSLSNRHVSHKTDKLVTIVNQTRIEAAETRDKLNELGADYNSLKNQTESQWRRSNAYDHARAIGNMVQALVSLDEALYREVRALDSMREGLRAGRLAEEVFPPSLFQEAFQEARSHGLRPMVLEWYYEHTSVQLMLVEDGKLVYRVPLPLVKEEHYLSYKIQSWGVTNGTDIMKTIKTQKDIAIHTSEGYYFVPKSCYGRGPQMCRTGAIYTQGAYRCAMGIIASHKPDSDSCTYKKETLTSTRAEEIDPGRFILQTLGEDFTISCRGQQQEKRSIRYGTYELLVKGGCRVKGANWLIEGEVLRFGTAAARQRRINVTTIEIHELPDEVDKHLSDYEPIKPDNDIDVNDVVDDWYPMTEIGHHISISNVVLIVMIIAILCVIGRYAYKRRKDIKYYFGTPKETTKSEGTDQPKPVVVAFTNDGNDTLET